MPTFTSAGRLNVVAVELKEWFVLSVVEDHCSTSQFPGGRSFGVLHREKCMTSVADHLPKAITSVAAAQFRDSAAGVVRM